MWPFSNKKPLSRSGIFAGFTDPHCHLLPGVDDGVETMDETLAILSRYESLGVAEVWLTPHVMEDMPNTPLELRRRFSLLRDAYKGSVTLRLASENMLDGLFVERLREGELLPWGREGNRLLVETSYYTAPVNFRGLLEDTKKKGFFPVLAHPERYMYMTLEDCRRLRQEGVELQMNLFSLFGMYGVRARKNAMRMLDEGLYGYVATDLHSFDTLETALHEKLSTKTIEQIKQILKTGKR